MTMSTRAEQFKNILSGIQSLVLVIAIVTGGLWTLFKFGLESAESPMLNITIRPSQVSIAGDPGRWILASIEMTNVGSRTETITWPKVKSVFTAHRVSIDERGALKPSLFS